MLYLDTTVCTLDDYRRFTNLEVLRVRSLANVSLEMFKRLKRLEYVGVFVPHTHQNARKLFKQAKVGRRVDFQMFYHGVQIFDGIEEVTLSDPLGLQIRNYSSLANVDLSFVTNISYTNLMFHFSSLLEPPADFFSMFFNIQTVTTSAPVNNELFLKFIQNCPYLVELGLKHSALGYWMADLPRYCNLSILKIEDSQYIDDDFGFILRFDLLKTFSGFGNFAGSTFSLAIRSILNLSRLSFFKFQNDETSEYVEITKNRSLYTVHLRFGQSDVDSLFKGG